MTNMDEQIAKYCKDIILRAADAVAEQREQSREAESPFNQALRVLKERKYHPSHPISQHDLFRLTKTGRSTGA
jgi:hypothetical protein